MNIIDVWDVGTFDPDLLEALEENAGLIRAYFDIKHKIFHSYDLCCGPDRPILRPENPHAEAYYALCDAVGELMASRIMRAFHYTRLTDDEVEDFRRSGIHLSTPETLRHRLDALVKSGSLPTEVATQLYVASPFQGDQVRTRSGMFWMLSHPTAVDDSGVVRLMNRWGGEVASFFIEDASLIGYLTRLGKARIIEVATPLDATCHRHDAAKAVIATFGRFRGALPEKSAFDLNVKTPLPATAVLNIHTEGEEAFAAMGRTYPPGFVDVDVGR